MRHSISFAVTISPLSMTGGDGQTYADQCMAAHLGRKDLNWFDCKVEEGTEVIKAFDAKREADMYVYTYTYIIPAVTKKEEEKPVGIGFDQLDDIIDSFRMRLETASTEFALTLAAEILELNLGQLNHGEISDTIEDAVDNWVAEQSLDHINENSD